jgi:hypothetical protein
MTSTALKVLASFALCAALTTGTAFARNQDHDRGKAGSSHHNTVRDRDRDHDRARVRDRDRDRDRREWRERREARERRWRREHRQNAMFGNNGQPRGWTQGRKTGWNDCNLPPGQAKKAGCISTWGRTHDHHSTRARRDRDHDGDRD